MADDDFVIVRIPGAPTLYRVPRSMAKQRCRRCNLELHGACECYCVSGLCGVLRMPGSNYCEGHVCKKCTEPRDACPEHGCRARGGCRAETVDGKLYCSHHLCPVKDCCLEAEDCVGHRCEKKSDGFFYKGKRGPGLECTMPKEPGSLFCIGHKCLHCVLGVSQWNDRVCDDHRCKYRTSRHGGKTRNCRYIGGELPDGQHCASHVLAKELHPCECNSCRRDPTVKDANKT
jgi:hypothetical protein